MHSETRNDEKPLQTLGMKGQEEKQELLGPVRVELWRKRACILVELCYCQRRAPKQPLIGRN